MSFLRRVHQLPTLGLGVSTEYGAIRADGALDIFALAQRPDVAPSFLEVGVEVEKGFDDDARRWIAAGKPTTYHFLDVNLDDAPGDDGDLDDTWLDGVFSLVREAKPAWLCGDAGWWHFGVRDRAQMLLLPPILTDESATDIARGVARLREVTGHEVLPETPPGTAYVGDLHLLEFFARVAARADTGVLLDVAHLAMYQHVTGRSPLDGLDAFPLERVVEVHVAGGALRDVDGFSVIDDTHGTEVLKSTWAILAAVCEKAPNLKAIVFECERNRTDTVVDGFARIRQTWHGSGASE
jgi:uncharacterized protein